VRYRIEVRDPVSARVASAFAPLGLAAEDGGRVLVGDLEDQAAVFAALERLRSLGLQLVALEPVGRTGSVMPPEADGH
jgi:hypothetical protein